MKPRVVWASSYIVKWKGRNTISKMITYKQIPCTRNPFLWCRTPCRPAARRPSPISWCICRQVSCLTLRVDSKLQGGLSMAKSSYKVHPEREGIAYRGVFWIVSCRWPMHLFSSVLYAFQMDGRMGYGVWRTEGIRGCEVISFIIMQRKSKACKSKETRK